MSRILNILLITFTAFTLFACGLFGSKDDELISDHLKDGWQSFSEKQYNDAIDSFIEALNIDGKNMEANVGIGWSSILLDETNKISEAEEYLTKCINDESWKVDAYSGLALIKFYTEYFIGCAGAVDSVMVTDSLYAFNEGKPNSSIENIIDYKDLLLFKAQTQYLENLVFPGTTPDYAACLQTIKRIPSDSLAAQSVVLDSIDIYDRETWFIGEKSFWALKDFIGELLYILSQELLLPGGYTFND
ncbi:hypothetical protein KAJ27_06085 [bacterium]|nr:hypothetical protein [bacterium]